MEDVDSRNKEEETQVCMGPNVTSFFKTLLNLTTCPISQAMFTEPYLATDHKTYNYQEIAQWLAKSQQSPLTREAMRAEDLIQD